MDEQKIEAAVRQILEAVDENPDREGLKETPRRVANMYKEVLSGSNEDPKKHLETFFNELQSGDLVLVSNIEFHSLCEHHMLPFIGKIHIAYIPNRGKILGLSKLGRIVETFSKRLQVQERLTSQIGSIIMEKTNPKGVYVIVEAEHMCMAIRGVRKSGVKTTTSVALGDFARDDFLKTKVLNLIRNAQ